MKNRIASALSFTLFALAALPAAAQNQAWIRQLGTSGHDLAWAAAPDSSGGVYVGGETDDSLGGPSAGLRDGWLARYDSAGNQIWVRQLGTSGDDRLSAAAPDGSGGVYVSGLTAGSLGGPNSNPGWFDAWLARYDGAGNQIWIRQFGTNDHDSAWAVAPDGSGGVYVGGNTGGSLGAPNADPSGHTPDVWLARYDGRGNLTWIRQFGTTDWDFALSAAPDGSGGVYVGGSTSGSLGGPNAQPNGATADVWLARYDGAGNRTWIRQLGTSLDDRAIAAAADGSGGVYVSGDSYGSLGGPNSTPGHSDAWLARYDGTGNQTWIRQLGTNGVDRACAAAPDGWGGVYVGGFAEGFLGGPSAGDCDAWLARYDSAGNQTWIRQLGTSGFDGVYAAATIGSGGVFVSGATNGSLGGPNVGSDDAWLARYDAPCGTISSYCTAGTSSHGCVPSIAGSGVASASAGSGFTISVSNVEGAQSGLIFYGLSGALAFPWGTSTSFLCVKSPLERTPVQYSGGTYNACNGTLALDWNLYIASTPLALGNPFAGGEVVRAQAWFRDPPSPKTSNLSSALQFSVCP